MEVNKAMVILMVCLVAMVSTEWCRGVGAQEVTTDQLKTVGNWGKDKAAQAARVIVDGTERIPDAASKSTEAVGSTFKETSKSASGGFGLSASENEAKARLKSENQQKQG